MVDMASSFGAHSPFADVALTEMSSNEDAITGESKKLPPAGSRTGRGRPCDACRKRKSRCSTDEGAAKCVLCSFHNQDCTFVEDIPPRKRKSVHIEENVQRNSQDTIRRRFSGNTDNVKVRAVHAGEDYADLKGPSLLKRTLGLQRRHHAIWAGSSGSFEPSLLSRDSETSTNKLPRGSRIRYVNHDDLFLVHSDEATTLFEDEIRDLDAIENLVAPHGQALINLYFRIVHPSFPILHKKVFLEKYNRTYREFSPVLLASVYILAMDYWCYSSALSGFPEPNVEALEHLASKCMSYAIHRPKLSTVEAGLLLLQRSNEATWPLSAQIIAVGQEIGLHRDCSGWDIPDWERGLRKRLAWALFMQDKWASLTRGRPSHIFDSEWHAKPLSEEDFPENFADENDEEGSTEVEIGRTLFICMSTLTKILADILTKLYSTAAEEASKYHTEATKHLLAEAKSLQIRLKDWHAQIPACLGIEEVKFRKLSSAGYLHLAYWATELTLHRPILRTLPDCSDRDIVQICQQAATARSTSAIQFVEKLKPEHWQSFWYFASEYNFGLIGLFECLIFASSSSLEIANASGNRLDKYLWSLKMAKKNAGFLEKSISMIETAAEQAKLSRRSAGKPASAKKKNGQNGQSASPADAHQEDGLGNGHEAMSHDTATAQSPDSSFSMHQGFRETSNDAISFDWDFTFDFIR